MKFRLWRLGSLEHRIMPSDQMIEHFKQKLAYVRECGGDLISGPEVNFSELEVVDMDLVIPDIFINSRQLHELETRLVSVVRQYFEELTHDPADESSGPVDPVDNQVEEEADVDDDLDDYDDYDYPEDEEWEDEEILDPHTEEDNILGLDRYEPSVENMKSGLDITE